MSSLPEQKCSVQANAEQQSHHEIQERKKKKKGNSQKRHPVSPPHNDDPLPWQTTTTTTYSWTPFLTLSLLTLLTLSPTGFPNPQKPSAQTPLTPTMSTNRTDGPPPSLPNLATDYAFRAARASTFLAPPAASATHCAFALSTRKVDVDIPLAGHPERFRRRKFTHQSGDGEMLQTSEEGKVTVQDFFYLFHREH
jgi:hypothetical protein